MYSQTSIYRTIINQILNLPNLFTSSMDSLNVGLIVIKKLNQTRQVNGKLQLLSTRVCNAKKGNEQKKVPDKNFR